MYVDVKEKVGVEGDSVEEVVEDGAHDGDAGVHHRKEGQHLKDIQIRFLN